MQNPVTPNEYQRMYELKQKHDNWELLPHEEVDLLFELLGRMYDELEKR